MFSKRIFDILFSVIGLIILAPLLLIISILIAIQLGRPIFFYQLRPGLNGKPFKIIKFRTLTNEKNTNGDFLPDSQRLTKLGSFLRSTSLDELPELINVLKGDMSLVGPRPLRMSYLPLYNEKQMCRHHVRPGITGWAQVNGRNTISWEKKFEYDVWYVDNQSFWLDVKIILLTVKKVFSREGINQSENITMEPFRGSVNK